MERKFKDEITLSALNKNKVLSPWHKQDCGIDNYTLVCKYLDSKLSTRFNIGSTYRAGGAATITVGDTGYKLCDSLRAARNNHLDIGEWVREINRQKKRLEHKFFEGILPKDWPWK